MKFITLFLIIVTSLHAESIKVGILHSLTGTMALSEKPVVDATLLAIEQLNQQGGLLGKKIVPIIIDGASADDEFAKGAEKLIIDEKVSVVFGCWSSASRKAVKPIFEKHNHLLFYPIQYEGSESSENIVYTGAAPNQQIIPGTKWCADNLGKRFFLVGSDFIFSKKASEIIKKVINSVDGEVVGEAYIPLGSDQVANVVETIVKADPDVILNTINGDTNQFFFNELRRREVSASKTPTMSFSIGINEILKFGLIDKSIGDYACCNYFQSIESEENDLFIESFRHKFGQKRHLSDPMEAAYIGVHLWAQAVIEANVDDAKSVAQKIKGQVYLAPEGFVVVDRSNHLWKHVRIGQLNSHGEFSIVWSSGKLIKPNPYPFPFGDFK